jgi:hypothetical protein
MSGQRLVDSVRTAANDPANQTSGVIISADISSSIFHPIAQFSQEVRGFAVTTSRTVSYTNKTYYEDDEGDIQSYERVTASMNYSFTEDYINVGERGRLPYFNDVPEEQELQFPDKPIRIDGWGYVYAKKSLVSASGSDVVGSWSATERFEDGSSPVSESGDCVLTSRGDIPFMQSSDVAILESNNNKMYFILNGGIAEGPEVSMYDNGSPTTFRDGSLWFGGSSFGPSVDPIFSITKSTTFPDPATHEYSSVSSPISGVNMEGLRIYGPLQETSDTEPTTPVDGDVVRTYTYSDSMSLTWLYF